MPIYKEKLSFGRRACPHEHIATFIIGKLIEACYDNENFNKDLGSEERGYAIDQVM
jgi:hypothetical protein